MPFDYGSFFTPRFPMLSQIKRDRSNEPLGPELPPELINKYAMEEQEQLPEWKKKVRGLFESGVDATAGMLGLPAYPQTKSYGMGELTSAGMPFLALGKKLKLPEIMGKPIVYRGDPGVSEVGNAYKVINPQFYNRADTLGHMTHAAEDLDYATNSYAYRKGSPIQNNQLEWYHPNAQARPNVTPLTSTAQNAVDLTRLPEDPVDVEKLIKGLKQWNPERSPFGEADRLTRKRADSLVEEIPYLYRRQQDLDKKLREGTRLTASDDRAANDIAMEMKDIRAVLNDPDIAKGTKFDAIRYDDEGRTSWAFPEISKLETPWGTKIGSKSMGDYPYRLSTVEGGSEAEQLGHFATKREALKHAAEKFPEEYPKLRIYLGAEKVSNVRKPNLINLEQDVNPGLKGYIKQDEKIQNQITKAAAQKKSQALDSKNAVIEKLSQQQHGSSYHKLSWQDKAEVGQQYHDTVDSTAASMYGKKFSDLNEWQKEDVHSTLKYGKSVFKATKSEPVFSVKVSNELSNDLYGKPYHKLDEYEQDAVKQNWLDDNDLEWEDDYLEEPIGPPGTTKVLKDNEIKDLIEEKGIIGISSAQVKSYINKPAPSIDMLSQDFFGMNYDKLPPSLKTKIDEYDDLIEASGGKSLISKGYSPHLHPDAIKSSMGTKEFSVELPEYEDVMSTAQKSKTYNVTDEDIQKFAKKDYLLDEIAEHYYGRSFKDLDKDEAEFIADVHYRAQVIK